MRYRLLGRSGLMISELSLGTMTFGGSDDFWQIIGRVGQKEADGLVAHAIDSGVNFFDTANVYSDGMAEQILGKALGQKRHDVIVGTKVRVQTGTGENSRGLSRVHIMQELDKSLKRIGTDYIDLYQIHGADPATPLDVILRTMDDLVRSGKVRYVGCSNLAGWHMMKAHGICEQRGYERFVSSQSFYSLAERSIEREIVDVLRDTDMGLLVWSPLAGGLLTGKFSKENTYSSARMGHADYDYPPLNRERVFAIVDVVRDVADKHGATPAQVSIAWLLAQESVTSVVLGVKTGEQLKANLSAAAIELDEDDMHALDEASKPAPEYPRYTIDYLRDRVVKYEN